MTEQERQRQIDVQSIEVEVDELLDAIGMLLGRRIVTGHNRVPLRRLIETAMIEVLHLHDHKTPLDQPRVALEAVTPAQREDPRAPTVPLDRPRRVTDIGPRRGPR